ncbi:MAG: methionine--tRNA ligase [Eggerthellaceae bacterium]|jgi:methionyl-tRNA synthetase
MASDNKVVWPKRAVVTAGMPYGNKPLHLGHIGGVFIPADCYARFLRDRIGAQNVIFVSGTDCFGSPINEGYRKLVAAGEFSGSIFDYVMRNHAAQKATLDAYAISCDIYEGSGIGLCSQKHQELTDAIIERLYNNGYLQKRETLQFYDPVANTFLNGRQVIGHCPVQGCKSEHAYADECDLGHQYDPEELIAPKSSITGETPEMRPVANWYFDLPAFHDVIADYVRFCEDDPDIRALVPKKIEEFLGAPVIFVNQRDNAYERYLALADRMPAHEYRPVPKGKSSFELEFKTIDDRDVARDLLLSNGIKIRTGKTLVPFRITGNIEWGVRAPKLEDGMEGLTVWCWPESLWAPISFTRAELEKRGAAPDAWKDFWASDDAEIYQFIGEDNIYFYGVAQPALWVAAQAGNQRRMPPEAGQVKQSRLIANYHVLFQGKKASSSSAVKPPKADELLEHYSAEQLRAHFLALALDQRAASFDPKAFAEPEKRDNPRVSDPVLKEGALLTKTFNRLARSCLYEAKNHFDCQVPIGDVSPEYVALAKKTMARYERTMKKAELHSIMQQMDEFIRKANKTWSRGSRAVEALADSDTAADGTQLADKRRQVLIDCTYLLRICTLLMHPVAPVGTEKICEYLQFDPKLFFSWEGTFEGLDELCTDAECAAGFHAVKELPPRTDFFKAHPSQYR